METSWSFDLTPRIPPEARSRSILLVLIAMFHVATPTAAAFSGGAAFQPLAEVSSTQVTCVAADATGFVVGGEPAFNDPVTILDLVGAAWKITNPAPPHPGALWGQSVARSEGRIAIGAPSAVVDGVVRGSVAILERDRSGIWHQTATIAGLQPNESFGWSVALEGDLLVVGAPHASVRGGASAGTARVWLWVDGAWSFQTSLEAASPAAGEEFGSALALSSNRLLVGAADASQRGFAGAGEVSTFVRRNAVFASESTLLPPDLAVEGRFGSCLAADDGVIAIGAPGVSVRAERDGAVYTTSPTTRGWTPLTRVDAGLEVDELGFGSSLIVTPDRLVAAAARLAPIQLVQDFRSIDQGWELIRTFGLRGPITRFGARVAMIASSNPPVIALSAIDLDCEPPQPGNDCDNDYLPDACQLEAQPGMDVDQDGIIDSCPSAQISLAAVTSRTVMSSTLTMHAAIRERCSGRWSPQATARVSPISRHSISSRCRRKDRRP